MASRRQKRLQGKLAAQVRRSFAGNGVQFPLAAIDTARPKTIHAESKQVSETESTQSVLAKSTLPADAQVVPSPTQKVHRGISLLVGHGGVTEGMVHSIIDGHGILTIDELKRVPDTEILEWKQFGPGRLAKIKAAIQIVEA